MTKSPLLLSLLTVAILAGCSTSTRPGKEALRVKQLEKSLDERYQRLTPEMEEKVLALDPEHVSEQNIREVLANLPAPRIVMLQGGLVPVQVAMKSFSRFIIGMGYPEWCARNPNDGAYSYSSYRSSSKVAGLLAGYYEREGLRPMLLGHSLGGMQAIKVLQKLANKSSPPDVWNPLTEKPEHRHTIHDPLTGQSRSVNTVSVCYVCTLASGGLGRAIPHQWNNFNLRKVPDSVEEFTGYYIHMDVFGGDYLGFGRANLFHATGSAHVRNVQLLPGSNHWTVPLTEELLQDQATMDWINNYTPDTFTQPDSAYKDNVHVLWAADVWHSIKRHWVIELQNYIRARRARAL